MNLNILNKNGRKYLFINKSYRDEQGKSKKKHIQSVGYLDDLEKEYPDPIAHFREVARKMTEEEKARRRVMLHIDMEETLPMDSAGTRNFGYVLPLSIYHTLGIDKFLKGKALKEKFKFNTNSIMILLVMCRLLSPGSKKRAFEEKGRFFERFDFSDDDIYRSLDHFDCVAKDLQRHIYESVKMTFGSDTSIIYYDVTNYYFEIKKPDDFRKHGVAKDKRKRPIVQMGLAMDANGIPLHYELFPGNMLDKETFRSVIGEVRKNYDTGRVVAVADMGIITGDNIYYLVGSNPDKPKNGYIFSFTVRGGTKKFQDYVLDERGYTQKDGKPLEDAPDFKIKTRLTPRDIEVTMQNGKKKRFTVHEKQIVFWSEKHCLKQRAERAEVLAKAEALIADPKKFTKATSYGAAAYVNNIEYDKNTGEVLTGKQLSLNLAKIEEDEKFDGYYAIVTSELNMETSKIVETYRGLWEIEESFRITKSDLEARPVHVQGKEHINAHFLTCFIALTILRLIQKKIGWVYSAAKIIECLNKIECINEHENIYLFGYRSPISDTLGKAFGIDFSKRRLQRAEIKNFSATAKNT